MLSISWKDNLKYNWDNPWEFTLRMIWNIIGTIRGYCLEDNLKYNWDNLRVFALRIIWNIIGTICGYLPWGWFEFWLRESMDICLEDVRDGNEVSGSVEHHSTMRKVWRVLNLRRCEVKTKWKKAGLQPGLLLEEGRKKRQDPKQQAGTGSPLHVWRKEWAVDGRV